MSEIDVTAEWQRLATQYAEMSDEELQTVADDGYELTDIARQALQAEISQRNLAIKLRERRVAQEETAPDPDSPIDPADLDLVVAASVWDVEEAKRLKQALDLASIPAYLGPANSEDFSTPQPGSPSGVAVKVREVDLQRAYAAMAHSSPPEEGDSPEPEYAGRCPNCHSTEIVFEGLDEEPTGDEPAAAAKFNWNCDACGHHWKDDGIEPET